MNLKTVVALLFAILNVMAVHAQKKQLKFDRSAFYKAIASEDIEQLDIQLRILQAYAIAEKEGFEGALQMKKAGLVGNPKDKWSLFKSGHKDLEDAISKDENNAEFRFLRLIIQENAPRILGYHDDLERDSGYIHKVFKSLSPIVQHAIVDYSKKSKILNPKDFKIGG